MKWSVDQNSPVPLYHQIGEAIRYQIATGRYQPGDRLPTVRQAAGEWDVHLHTVRRAYAELARQGLVDVTRARGTTVLKQGQTDQVREMRIGVHREIARFARMMQQKHSLSRRQLADLLYQEQAKPTVRLCATFVECSLHQAADYAGQLEAHWDISVTPWTLDKAEPPPGLILSSYFHYNDVRGRWPRRVEDLYFLAVRPDSSLATHLARTRKRGGRTTITLAETDEARADSILADLLQLLSAKRFVITRKIVKNAKGAVRLAVGGPVLLAPRLWAQLSDRQRDNPNLRELRYVLSDAEVRDIAVKFAWSERRQESVIA